MLTFKDSQATLGLNNKIKHVIVWAGSCPKFRTRFNYWWFAQPNK